MDVRNDIVVECEEDDENVILNLIEEDKRGERQVLKIRVSQREERRLAALILERIIRAL